MRLATMTVVLRPAVLTAALLGLTSPAWAVYKIVGPDGQVTFTDVPPPGERAQARDPQASAPEAIGAGLPAELQRLTQRAPVVLYVTAQCAACDAGAQLLRERGIPYSTRTVQTPADADAYKHLSGGVLNMPLLSIAGVALPSGFNSATWNQALNAAGYPLHSQLPGSYREPAPQALAPQAPAAVSAPKAGARTPAVPVLPPPDPHAPPGFKF